MTSAPLTAYPPATLDIVYTEEPRNQHTVFLRLIWAIPAMVLFYVLVNSTNVIVIPTLLTILFRRKYPRWWFDFNLELERYEMRLFAYLILLVDEYPSTDEEQRVDLRLVYPDAETELNRWLPLVKWILLLPHYIVLSILAIGVVVATFIAWFAILFTGSYPRVLFNFVVGWNRWLLRVTAYGWLLTTDRYPPFSME